MTSGIALLIILLLAISLGSAFYLVQAQDYGEVSINESTINMERFDLTLVSDADNARIVECDFLFSIDQDKRVPVIIGGDIANATLSSGAFYSAGDVTVVRGTTTFVFNEPAEPGDEVEIMIWHGINKTAVTVILEAAA